MGLTSSKQPKEFSLGNPETPAQVFVTEEAISNVLKTVNESSKAKEPVQEKIVNEFDLRLLPDLHDKRIEEYEKNMIQGLKQSSKQVEDLFRERYNTLPVCQDLQAQVSKCYAENSKYTLNCLDVANQFIKCVEQERQKKFGVSLNDPKAKSSRGA